MRTMEKTILSKLVDVIKDQTPKFAFAGFIVSGFILFFPKYSAAIGLDRFLVDYGRETGLVFLACAALLLWELLAWISKWNKENSALRKAKKRLHNLTPEEKEILCSYIEENTKTQELNIFSGVVVGLNDAGIIYYAVDEKFNIRDWAWNYLKKNKHLLY